MLESFRPSCAAIAAIAVASLVAVPAAAQYKVVRPDGSVTYTDRAPSDPNVRVIQLGRDGVAPESGPESGLPPDLRQAAQRYPVTLYTSADCVPCDSARRMLQQRGIPFSEKRIVTEDDAQALQRLIGARTVPSLSIGRQPLRGFSETDWTAYLDAAGYPQQSKLPADWRPPPATPLVSRSSVATAGETPPAPAASAPERVERAPGGFQF
jgi:glutaredoxin